jgi:hypothetical protein
MHTKKRFAAKLHMRATSNVHCLLHTALCYHSTSHLGDVTTSQWRRERCVYLMHACSTSTSGPGAATLNVRHLRTVRAARAVRLVDIYSPCLQGGTVPVLHVHACGALRTQASRTSVGFAAVSGPRHAMCIRVKVCMYVLCNFAFVCGLSILRCAAQSAHSRSAQGCVPHSLELLHTVCGAAHMVKDIF